MDYILLLMLFILLPTMVIKLDWPEESPGNPHSLYFADPKEIGTQAEHGHAACGDHAKVQGGVEAARSQQAVSQAVYAVSEGVRVGQRGDKGGEAVHGIEGAGEKEEWVEDEVQDKSKAISVFQEGGHGQSQTDKCRCDENDEDEGEEKSCRA